MQTHTGASKESSFESEEEGRQQGQNTARLGFSEWAPKVILWLFGISLGCIALEVIQFAFRAAISLHSSRIPWWGAFFVYAFLAGVLLRGRREFAGWATAMKSKWGVINRWVHSLT